MADDKADAKTEVERLLAQSFLDGAAHSLEAAAETVEAMLQQLQKGGITVTVEIFATACAGAMRDRADTIRKSRK